MSALTPRTLPAPRGSEQPNSGPVAIDSVGIDPEVGAGTEGNRIPLTVRTRHKVLRMAPPVDDGFRPFRVF